MAKVNCSIHGEQDETFVCQHIVIGLETNTPCGFWYAKESDQRRPDAWCTMCNELVAETEGEWTEQVLSMAKIKLLCGECYDRASPYSQHPTL